MKRILSILVTSLLIGYTPVFGQTHFLTLNDQRIDLSATPFTITKVIDERVDKSNIGWTQKGMGNMRVNAGFTNPFDVEILDFLRNNLGSEGPEIQVVIRNLKIAEKTGFSKETGTCELSVDFLLEDASSLYRVLQTTVVAEVTGTDVTKKHPTNIASAFKMSFERLSSVDLSDKKNLYAIALSDIGTDLPDSIKYNYPIFTQPIKNGVYADYEELKNNNPSNMDSFYIEKRPRQSNPWLGTFEVIPKFEGSNQKVKKVWAIALDGEVYVYHQREFFPLSISHYELFFQGYGIPSGQGVSTGALIGGLIGAGIASGIESSNAKKQMVSYYIDPSSGGISRTVLEMTAK
ncbi:hypothetical protein ADIS_2580 [Lunatimonas lonarensis]|uniref:Uncharacterized protein n=1 Tax=Lunatimonas lonarensis TaxID=1232681 RepID=R7ZSD5_9BACT|nr:hypothetical protein [Lunatimonas lonarensis]EON76919.1 hypothetical protein ADIS_2580 [Lunatimonas lonarensis]